MATSNSSSDNPVEPLARVSQYDLLLAVMPVPLLAGLTAGIATGVPAVGGMGLGSLVSFLLVAYGLFVATPSS